MKKFIAAICLFLIGVIVLTGCESTSTHTTNTDVVTHTNTTSQTIDLAEGEETKDPEFASSVEAQPDKMDFELDADDNSVAEVSKEQSTVSIDLSESDQTESSKDKSASENSVASTVKEEPNLIKDITAGGTYTLTGSKTDGMLTINAGQEEVQLIFKGVTIENSTGPALYVKSASKVKITLAEGTINTLSDGKAYTLTDGDSQLNAALFSRADLTINGTGHLVVNGNCKHGIVSKDDLVISDGTIQVTAANVGIEGKDCVKIGGGNITVDAGTDGIRSDNATDSTKGFVSLTGGNIQITAGNDGVQAETVLNAKTATLNIVAGGGAGSANPTEGSYKGMKAGAEIMIADGDFHINAADDAIRCGGNITVTGGNFVLQTGDDAVQADADLTVSGGTIAISCANDTKSNGLHYENTATVTGGNIAISGAKQSTKLYSNIAQGYFIMEVGTQPADTEILLKDANGKVLMTHTAKETFTYVVFCHSQMVKGQPYTLTVGTVSQTVTAQ